MKSCWCVFFTCQRIGSVCALSMACVTSLIVKKWTFVMSLQMLSHALIIDMKRVSGGLVVCRW